MSGSHSHHHHHRSHQHGHSHSSSHLSDGEAHELHAHKKGDAKHSHTKEISNQNLLIVALILTLSFSVVEMIASYLSNSLALISDAGHMVTDAASLGLAVLAQMIARRPPSPKHSFGFGRAEALAAFVNGIAMLALVAWIVFEAITRFFTPHIVNGMTVTIVAALGLLMNVVVAWVLSKDQKSVNTRAALLHVMGDLLGSVAALVAGLVIQYTGWMPIDSLLSILVSLLILKSTFSILHESYHFLMEGVPPHINYLQVGSDLKAVPGVVAVHDLHIWEMTPSFPALIGHIEVEMMKEWPQTMSRIHDMLYSKHGIDHVTLQPEESQSLVEEDSHDYYPEEVPKAAPMVDASSPKETEMHPVTHYVVCRSGEGKHRMAYHAWGDPQNPRVLICAHGLSRRGSDFASLAKALCGQYYVVCPDVVGRGESDRLSNPIMYSVPQYVSDMKALVAHLGVNQVDWIGTSMGGLIGIVFAALPNSPIRRMIINDVGPFIEPAAIERLSSYVGKPFAFQSRAEALEALNRICATFGDHTPEEWEILNGPQLEEKDGVWGLHYDPNIAVPFTSVNSMMAKAGEMAMWHTFKQIHIPMLIVRGGDSDLLSAATVAKMCKVNPYARSIEIPHVGHAPAFIKPEQIALAKEFFSS